MFDGMAKFSQVVGVPLVAVPLVWFGWRGAFWMTAGLSFLFLIVFWISYRDPSEDAHLSPVERDYILAGGARPRVERGRHGRNLVDAMHAEISAFWKILAQQSVGVLVGAALPRAVRIAEIDLDASVDLQACVLSHLSSLIPSQRPTQLLRQGNNRSRNGVAHRLGTMSGECGSVFNASLVAMIRHAWQVRQQGEARHALYQGADRGTAKAQDEILFPVARHGAINCPRRTLADHDLGRDKGLAPSVRTRSRYPVPARIIRGPIRDQASF